MSRGSVAGLTAVLAAVLVIAGCIGSESRDGAAASTISSPMTSDTAQPVPGAETGLGTADLPGFPRTFALLGTPPDLRTAASFDIVIQDADYDVAAARLVNPDQIALLSPGAAATYGRRVIESPGFDAQRCLLRHPDSELVLTRSANPHPGFNMTRPDCVDAIAQSLLGLAREDGIEEQPWDGIYLDNFIYHPYFYAQRTDPVYTDADSDQDGSADAQVALERKWEAGVVRLAERVRAGLPGMLVMGNGAEWDNSRQLDGVDFTIFERDLEQIIDGSIDKDLGDLIADAARWNAPVPERRRLNASLLSWRGGEARFTDDRIGNRDAALSDPVALRRMRIGLAGALMAGLAYGFEFSDEYGSYLRYDEYTGGTIGRSGWLGAPLGPPRRLASGVWRRDFDGGSALLSLAGRPVAVDLRPGLCRLRGDQAPKVNSGAPVGEVAFSGPDALLLARCEETPA